MAKTEEKIITKEEVKKEEIKKEPIKEEKTTERKVEQKVELKEDEIKKEKKEENEWWAKFVELKVKIPQNYYTLYNMLFEKVKSEHPKLSDEEINSLIFMDAISYSIIS